MSVNEVWTEPSVVTMVEGEVIPWAVQFYGADSLASPVSTVWKDGQDYSADVQLSGDSDSVVGDIMTLKKITAKEGDAGSAYIVRAEVEVDGASTERRKFKINVVSASNDD